jgi:hypothetical protein
MHGVSRVHGATDGVGMLACTGSVPPARACIAPEWRARPATKRAWEAAEKGAMAEPRTCWMAWLMMENTALMSACDATTVVSVARTSPGQKVHDGRDLK